MAAPTQLSYRTVKGIGILDATPVYESLSGFERPEGNLRCSAYSPCGRYFAFASPDKVTVVDPSVGHVISTIAAENVFELGFSPLGTYLITWQRPSKDGNGDAVKNLKVWQVVNENVVVGSYVQKSQTGWNLQYTADEKLCARVVTNEVQFYQSDDLSKPWNRLRVEGVADFALSPGKTNSVAVFIPERKGQPAAVKVFVVPNFASAVSQKNFFKGDKVQLKWNASGNTLLVLAQTEVDRSNKSYYGETTLYLLGASGGFDSRVELDKEGPIHDVSWSPNSKEFGVVYGYMPARTRIFNFRGVTQHDFPMAPRNTILFSPHGRFVLVAGFGNLAGQMDIYDLEKNYAKVTTVEAANSSVCAWSPDGQYILTATTSPRLRVDNGLRIWHVSGALVYNEDMHELYDVCWRPQSTIQHPLGDPFHPLPVPHPSATAYLSTRKAPVKPAGAYRPPGARGQLTPLAFKREDQGGSAFVAGSAPAGAVNGFGKPRRRDVPGADPAEFLPPGAAPGGGVALPPGADHPEKLSKSAARNKKKREARKLREGEEGVPETSPDRRGEKNSNDKGHERSRSKAQGQKSGPPANGTPAPAPPPPAREPTPPAVEEGVPSAHDKKIRGLLKKIRAIDELKMRLAGGEKLEDTQMKKIHTEESVRKELEGLGYTG
ncbi:translation initiation factor 2A [Aspergillus candidus]|uniref:Eukaryotic translation initiation factor 2A n=1 Tax=Aspergillus candidus TaxID=41067 RepID=A0A2I2FFC9_ASPCN|nr:translation initiation factor eIF-2A [Aspergillus candidus]PLB39331.1 translation initiation factor eIF-2A [Aspergillus candidus]